MLNLLGDFIEELRAAGLPISMTEHIDAGRAMGLIDMADRSLFKATLAATLVKDGDHMGVFNAAFDVYFANRRGDGDDEGLFEESEDGGADRRSNDSAAGLRGAGRPNGMGGGSATTMSAEELAQLLFRALADNDEAMMRQAASEAVNRYAGMEPGRPVGGTYYLYRTLRNLDLENLTDRLSGLEMQRQGANDDELGHRLARDEARARVEALKALVEQEIRERLVEDRGAEALARSTRKPLPEDLDVMHANRDEMAQLERALRPLSRKLAVRLARKRLSLIHI